MSVGSSSSEVDFAELTGLFELNQRPANSSLPAEITLATRPGDDMDALIQFKLINGLLSTRRVCSRRLLARNREKKVQSELYIIK